MKKITLLLAAAVMLAGGAYAEGKCCKKKGAKCTKESACCKDKKHCKKSCDKDAAKETKETKEAPKSNS
jgi:hypothetical protein